MRVSLIQSELQWQNPGANRAHFEEIIWGLRGNTDLIVLPEMFTTGFSMETNELFETMNLHTHKWMRQMSELSGAAVCGSIIIKENEDFFNRFIWVTPQGQESYYDKVHPFSPSGENKAFTAGQNKVIIEYMGVKIRPLICYDLRFPAWALNSYHREKGLEYDFLLVVANWPNTRIQAWTTLLKARAIENHSYVAGLNIVGTDGSGLTYNGHSGAYFADGSTMIESDKEEVLEFKIDLEKLKKHRKALPFFQDNRHDLY